MAGRGKVSDEKIGEALIKKVVEEETKGIPLEDVPFLTPDAEEKGIVNKVFALVRKVDDILKDDKEIQDGIDGLVREIEQGGIAKANKMFWETCNNIIKDGITWDKIVILIYLVGKVAGAMADRMVTALSQSVMVFLSWAVEYIKENILVWILEQGGWISFLVLPRAHTEEAFITEEDF